MHAKVRAVLAVAALPLVLTAGWASTSSSLVDSHSIETYRQAVAHGGRGDRGMAMALLEGILLTQTVRFRVETDSVPGERRDAYMDGVQASLRAWRHVAPEVHLQLVDPGEKADVVLRFTAEIEDGNGREQGLIQVQRHYFWGAGSHGYRLSGLIQIKDNAFGQALDGAGVSRVLSHELGHLLGLGDDYDGPGVMAAFRLEEERSTPSREETRAIQEYRSRVRRTLESISRGSRI